MKKMEKEIFTLATANEEEEEMLKRKVKVVEKMESLGKMKMEGEIS